MRRQCCFEKRSQSRTILDRDAVNSKNKEEFVLLTVLIHHSLVLGDSDSKNWLKPRPFCASLLEVRVV